VGELSYGFCTATAAGVQLLYSLSKRDFFPCIPKSDVRVFHRDNERFYIQRLRFLVGQFSSFSAAHKTQEVGDNPKGESGHCLRLDLPNRIRVLAVYEHPPVIGSQGRSTSEHDFDIYAVACVLRLLVQSC